MKIIVLMISILLIYSSCMFKTQRLVSNLLNIKLIPTKCNSFEIRNNDTFIGYLVFNAYDSSFKSDSIPYYTECIKKLEQKLKLEHQHYYDYYLRQYGFNNLHNNPYIFVAFFEKKNLKYIGDWECEAIDVYITNNFTIKNKKGKDKGYFYYIESNSLKDGVMEDW